MAAATLAVPARAVSGTAATDTSYSFTAKLEIGDSEATMRACSGALVEARWILTAASCFTRGLTELSPGAPPERTVVTVGRRDLTDAGDQFHPNGLITTVTELYPYQGRDLVLARLEQPASGVTPVSLAAAPAATGETLKAAGFGRTKTEWAPTTLHTAGFTVEAAQGDTVVMNGQDGAAVCAGDTGGPVVREKDGKIELVGINSRSWQGGCFGADPNESRTTAFPVDVADPAVSAWLKKEREIVHMADANGDGLDDMIVQSATGEVRVRLAKNYPIAVQAGHPIYRFDEAVRWSSGWSRFFTGTDLGRLYFADMNADNKADMIVHTTDGNIAIRLNTGAGFNGGTNWSTGWSRFVTGTDLGRLYFA
ncbi:S1 family peptidase, partial [Streptomyces sp. NPDC096079]|uniref:S1 family peptidase n=1 Tax=Streptomyces sp. NPDC096079 TaxID=3155820 RepID=UPI00332CFEA5